MGSASREVRLHVSRENRPGEVERLNRRRVARAMADRFIAYVLSSVSHPLGASRPSRSGRGQDAHKGARDAPANGEVVK